MDFGTIAFVSGKIILGAYFMLKGLNYFRGEYITGEGGIKTILRYITGFIIAISSLGIITGAYASLAISSILVYLILANAYLYNFWSYEENREAVKAQFYKNIAIIGGLLMLYTADWTIYGLGLTTGIF